MRTTFSYLAKVMTLRLHGIRVPYRGTRIHCTVDFEGKGIFKIGKIQARSHVCLSCKSGGLMIIGNGVFINRNTVIAAHRKISIGEGTTIGPNVCIYDHDHKFGAQGIMPGYKEEDVIIGNNVWIGANVVILRGTLIDDGCIIGAGCVIKGHIPAHSLVVTNRKNEISELY